MEKKMVKMIEGSYFYNGENVDFKFKPKMTVVEKNIFIDRVLMLLLTEQEEVVEDGKEIDENLSDIEYIMQTMLKMSKQKVVKKRFNYAMRDLAFDYVLATMIGGVHILQDKDGKDLKFENQIDTMLEAEKFLDETGVAEMIKADMDTSDLIELIEGINFNVEYLTGVKLNSVEDSVNLLLNTITSKVQSLDTEVIMEMVNKFNAISGEVDMEKILEVYSDSELFKRQIAKDEEVLKRQQESIKNFNEEVIDDIEQISKEEVDNKDE